MKKITFIFILLIVVIACEDPVNQTSPIYTVYYNSFEENTDTANIEGITLENFVFDAPPLGGYRSLRVSGGDTRPTVSFTFENMNKEAYYKVKLWGKILDSNQTAQVEFINSDSSTVRTLFNINERYWSPYRNDTLFYVKPNEKFRINVNVGGIIPASVLIDRFEIVYADPSLF